MRKHDRSHSLFQESCSYIPGGVNSPVRAFRAVGGNPLFFESAKGSRLLDADGNEYIDYVGSWGPMLLGHGDHQVKRAVEEALKKGFGFGAPTEVETKLARKICQLCPSVEKVRLVNSGTEATMSAIRLARAFTGRDLIVKFDGCYHGHPDSLLVQAGSGALTLGLADSPGVPDPLASLTISIPFNSPDLVEQVFGRYPNSIAAVIVEPIAGNMGVIKPRQNFLETLCQLCDSAGSLVIFDEVMTGFRVAMGGAQELYGLNPDLTCLGKIIGGGLPIGAYGGRRDIMDRVAPQGPVYQAGTLSGNPIAATAGLATLERLEQLDPYRELAQRVESFCAAIAKTGERLEIPLLVQSCGSMFTIFFTDTSVRDLQGAQNCDTDRFGQFFRQTLENGLYLAPSQFEACFVSTAHTQADLETTLEIIEGALTKVSRSV